VIDERRIKEIRLCAKKYKGFKEGALKALRLSRFT
jgi:hypothetical protein